MGWKKLLAYITGSVDEELLLRNEYLVTENRILCDQIQGRVRLNDAERESLAEIGKKLGKQALEEVALLILRTFQLCNSNDLCNNVCPGREARDTTLVVSGARRRTFITTA